MALAMLATMVITRLRLQRSNQAYFTHDFRSFAYIK